MYDGCEFCSGNRIVTPSFNSTDKMVVLYGNVVPMGLALFWMTPLIVWYLKRKLDDYIGKINYWVIFIVTFLLNDCLCGTVLFLCILFGTITGLHCNFFVWFIIIDSFYLPIFKVVLLTNKFVQASQTCFLHV